MTAPKRICLLPDDGWSWVEGPNPPYEENAIEYVRADLAAVRPAQVRVKAGEIERAVWLAMAWAVRNAKQLQCDILPAYTDSGNSDAETACRIASTRILAALEPHPDPRDDVIARLVDALSMAQLWLDYAGAYDMQGINAALAAAKAVQHG